MENNDLKLTPARIVLFEDIFLITMGLISALLLHYRILSIEAVPLISAVICTAAHSVFAVIFWFAFRIQKRVIRHFAVRDYMQIIFALACIHTVSFLFRYLLHPNYRFSLPVWVLSFFITTVYLLGSRIVIGYLFSYYKKSQLSLNKKKLLIFGAAELGLTLKKSIESQMDSGYHIMGFLDDDPSKAGKLMEGYEVYHAEKNLQRTIQRLGITDIIIATKTLAPVRKSKFLNDTIEFNLRIRELPSLKRWFDSQFNLNTIQQIDIHDLLNREPIQLQNDEVAHALKEKVILVTGAAGSIGSELVRRLAEHHALQIICMDMAESPLYDLQQSLIQSRTEGDFVYVLGDVRNEANLRHVFETYRPHFVFHAAAYKHVPIIEHQPAEGLQTNVRGTWLTATLAAEHGVEKFVLVSTDKAIHPTSIMGATKRMAEMVTQSLQQQFTQTEFIITRFGNVLGSNGSVVPLFKKQIEKGGPVTVTHPEMQRFFMTIAEAAQLVVEASLMGKGGEVFIFDMGQPVKIVDLAVNMIRLAGMVPGDDIQIEYTGIRPGEKLYEDLFADQEKVEHTHHKKIMIGKVQQYPYVQMEALLARIDALQPGATVQEMRELILSFVPEYKMNQQTTKLADV